MSFAPQNIVIQAIPQLWPDSDITLDVLRLDAIHPVISGNKWFKLNNYIAQAKKLRRNCLLTFGGAYSNHVLATAALCSEMGLASIGIIRGEASPTLSNTLDDAQRYGMELHFVTRKDYQLKTIPEVCRRKYQSADLFVVPEGGYGREGQKGIQQLFGDLPTGSYSHILVAMGTGTTLSGIVAAATDAQETVGISPFKNNFSLRGEINYLLPPGLHNHFELVEDYHFGGYAKYNSELIAFMNHWYTLTGIPSDIIYTGKLFYAINAMVQSGRFARGSRLLAVHTGGLQGNRSLEKGTLIFNHL